MRPILFPFANVCLQLTMTFTADQAKEMPQEIVDNCIQAAHKKEKSKDGYIVLGRGFAAVPLPGIDVPFPYRSLKHSQVDIENIPDVAVRFSLQLILASPLFCNSEILAMQPMKLFVF